MLRVIDTAKNIWQNDEKLATIKEIYAKNATNIEFELFCEIGKSTGLNPFLRELWLVKYGTAAASIFIGRDGYRKSAQACKDYDYHMADAVYENDEFSIANGEVLHAYQLKDRGKLIGGYAIAKRKSSSKSVFVFLDLKEYTTGKSLWVSKPATMIKKCAEAQLLRMLFQELFAGTYAEEEEAFIHAETVECEQVSGKTSDLNLELHESYNYNQLASELMDANTLDELQKEYVKTYKIMQHNKEDIAKLVQLKNSLKQSIETILLNDKVNKDAHV